MTWHDEVRTCLCGGLFLAKRETQAHCSSRCRDAAKKRRKRSGDKTLPPISVARSGDTGLSDAPSPFSDGSTVVWPVRDELLHGPTPGAFQGDGYPLEYYEDGYPKLPACLDRRRPIILAEAA
jgi:hypothetical protein